MTRNREITAVESSDIASYQSLEGASEAVAHLVELGFDEDEVAISPREFHVVERHELRRLLRVGVRLGALIGAVAAALVGLVSTVGLRDLVALVPIALSGAMSGVVVGLVIAMIRHRHQRSATFGIERDTIAPARYGVTVRRRGPQARHSLAQWWSPTAPPSGWQQSA